MHPHKMNIWHLKGSDWGDNGQCSGYICSCFLVASDLPQHIAVNILFHHIYCYRSHLNMIVTFSNRNAQLFTDLFHISNAFQQWQIIPSAFFSHSSSQYLFSSVFPAEYPLKVWIIFWHNRQASGSIKKKKLNLAGSKLQILLEEGKRHSVGVMSTPSQVILAEKLR